LLNIAQNISNEYNLRADATDVLLQLASDNNKVVAQEIIMKLGRERGQGKPKNIYNNAQNVHVKDVEESVLHTLEILESFELMRIPGQNIPITFEYVQNQILALENSNIEKIKISLNRIYMDRSLYSKYNCTIQHILLRIWTYISGHKHEEEMKKRLLEELIEMSGTCSWGYASRLVNTISGFGELGIRMSWGEQISANLTARLNKRIQEMDNLTLQGKILDELTLETDKYEDRKHLLKFIRKNLSEINEELYEEFKPYMSDTDFNLYFRRALSIYDTGNFT